MSYRNQEGFSIVELLIVAVVIGLMSGTFFIFFNSSIRSFFQIQESSILINNQTQAIYRMAQVIRSTTRITEASNQALTVYAYFSPLDSTLSRVRYYYDTNTRTLKVDRIRASGTAPNYEYLPANTETRTILYNMQLGATIFTYNDANGSNGPFTTTTYQDIKSVLIDLNTPVTNKANASQMKVRIELRSRKTNL